MNEISFSVKWIFVDDFNLYDIYGLGNNSLKEGEDKYETLPNEKKMVTKMKEYIIIFVMKELEMK